MKQSGRRALIMVMNHGNYALRREVSKGSKVVDKKCKSKRNKNSCDKMLNHRLRQFNKKLINQIREYPVQSFSL